MDIDWYPKKRSHNLAKHGVDFRDCESVFTDPNALTIEDTDHAEERFFTLGMDDLGRLVAIAYLWRGDTLRIISARKAQRHEAKLYPGNYRAT